MIDDETLLAYLDGDLDPARASVVAAAIASDPLLAHKAEQHRRLKEKLRHAFDALLHAPAPAVRLPASAQIIDFRPRRHLPQPLPSFGWRRYVALAAALAVGLVAGVALHPATAGSAAMGVASVGLARALDSQLSGDSEDGIRIQSSFRDDDGAICRGFTGIVASGVACRDGGQWRIAGLFPASGSTEDPQVTALAATLSAGKLLDTTQEKAARERGWR